MTNIYFVRHAEPDYTNHDDLTRPLTPKGKSDTALVTKFLNDKGIDVAYSSPYIRSVDTIMPFCRQNGLEINIVTDFRERTVSLTQWITGFDDFARRQWADFKYHLEDGECIQEVQARNISALNNVIDMNKNKNVVIASHGTALSTIVNYYCNTFSIEDFLRIKKLMPWIVKFTFDGTKCVDAKEYNVFTEEERCLLVTR